MKGVSKVPELEVNVKKSKNKTDVKPTDSSIEHDYQELLETESKKGASEKRSQNEKTVNQSSYNVTRDNEPLPLLARGNRFDEEPEAV